MLDEVLGFLELDGMHGYYGLGLERNFIGSFGLAGASPVGFVPETDGLKLGGLVLGGNLTRVTEGTRLPDSSPVGKVGTLLGPVIRLQRQGGQRGSLGIAKRSHSGGLALARGGEFSVGVGDVLGLCLRSRLGRSGGHGSRTANSVRLCIVILRSHACHGSQRVPAKIGDDGSSLLTSHASLCGDEGIGGDAGPVHMDDDGADTDSRLMPDGELEDGKVVLGEDGLQGFKVSRKRSVLRLVERVRAVGMNVLGFLDGIDQTDVQFDLIFVGVVEHMGFVIHREEVGESGHVLRDVK